MSESTEDRPANANPKQAAPPTNWFQRLRVNLGPTLAEIVGIDLRSIAIFRMAMGALVISDVYHRSLHLVAHYTDAGFMPREKLLGGWSNPLFYSFHNWGGDITSQTLLFALTGVFATMLVVGFKTRLASIMCFLMVASVQGRNYLILQGGDDLLRVMLFWSMFLPLGARFSIDAALAPPVAPRNRVARIFTVASTTIALQLLAMYLVSAVLKTGSSWHRQGSAIHLALHHEAFATSFGQWFRQLPAPLLQYMTWSVYYLELFGTLLFFSPFKTGWVRTAQVLLFMSFHFGLFLCMELGHFPWVALGAWLILLPSWFWEVPVRRVLAKLDLNRRYLAIAAAVRSFVVAHRDWFRTRKARPLRLEPTWAGTLVVALLAVYTAYGTAFAGSHKGNVEGDRFSPMLMLRLYANWGMFAPNPPNTSGWFIIVGERADGSQIDVWNHNDPVDWSRPELPSATYRSQRWRKFLDNVTNQRHAVVRPYFLRWLCKDWNESQEERNRVRTLTLYQMAHTTQWPAKGYSAVQKNNLQRQGCPSLGSKGQKGTDA
ncbi:MAG TPA: HTTM domain-containing protein [Polyangiaceae bacterium]|nr:HTTM domain-containing protein [Polyangiaceae bacterium]